MVVMKVMKSCPAPKEPATVWMLKSAECPENCLWNQLSLVRECDVQQDDWVHQPNLHSIADLKHEVDTLLCETKIPVSPVRDYGEQLWNAASRLWHCPW